MENTDTQTSSSKKPVNKKTLKKLVDSHKLEEAMEHSMGPEDSSNNITLDSVKASPIVKDQDSDSDDQQTSKSSRLSTEGLQDGLQKASEGLQDGLQKAYQRMGDLREPADRYRTQATSFVREKGEFIRKDVEERPLAYLAAGVVLGFVVGRLTTSTRR